MDLIDFDAGTTKKLSKSAYADIAGSISPDGKTAAWIDTRDPAANGKHSTWLDPYGGEVYTKDLLTGVETRVTWDSPATPTIKMFPRLVAQRLVWQSLAGIPVSYPQPSGTWELPAPLWFSVAGSAPAPLPATSQPVAFPQPLESGVVGVLVEPVDGGVRNRPSCSSTGRPVRTAGELSTGRSPRVVSGLPIRRGSARDPRGRTARSPGQWPCSQRPGDERAKLSCALPMPIQDTGDPELHVHAVDVRRGCLTRPLRAGCAQDMVREEIHLAGREER